MRASAPVVACLYPPQVFPQTVKPCQNMPGPRSAFHGNLHLRRPRPDARMTRSPHARSRPELISSLGRVPAILRHVVRDFRLPGRAIHAGGAIVVRIIAVSDAFRTVALDYAGENVARRV